MAGPLETVLTFIVLGFWFLFPIGMYLSAEELEKNKKKILYQPDEQRGVRIPIKVYKRASRFQVTSFHFRRWVRH